MTKKALRALILAVIVSAVSGVVPCAFPLSTTIAKAPEYAKWGIIAMERTKAKYRASIIDYLHVGRKQVSEDIAEETFKLWLKDGSREYGVRVSIRFYTANDRIISVHFQETQN
ncbi:DUF3889 domain-containing protein [Cohnella lupini]|uniref:DUF3889 domain-containing protein n=1 Tax=Cohnella lupini TaxID=1294267 RepID=UPI000E21F0AF|nr:DUF3889 domain-containing protein [Cohnella lupini]